MSMTRALVGGPSSEGAVGVEGVDDQARHQQEGQREGDAQTAEEQARSSSERPKPMHAVHGIDAAHCARCSPVVWPLWPLARPNASHEL